MVSTNQQFDTEMVKLAIKVRLPIMNWVIYRKHSDMAYFHNTSCGGHECCVSTKKFKSFFHFNYTFHYLSLVLWILNLNQRLFKLSNVLLELCYASFNLTSRATTSLASQQQSRQSAVAPLPLKRSPMPVSMVSFSSSQIEIRY